MSTTSSLEGTTLSAGQCHSHLTKSWRTWHSHGALTLIVTKGGIIGIMQRPSALQKRFLTAHERTATTTANKRMMDLDESTRSTHKESWKVRVQRDENDIKKVIHVHTLKTVMSGLFYEDAYREDFPLMSLATGVVMPEEISEQLIDAQCLGAGRIKLLLLWASVSVPMKFSFGNWRKRYTKKPLQVCQRKQRLSPWKLVTASVDRNLFGRLLIASRSREINLREVLKYELDPVPCALAHPYGSLRKTTKSVFLGIL